MKSLVITSFFGPKHYDILTCNSNVRYVIFKVNNTKCSWLLDTGASISAINKRVLSVHTQLFSDKIVINGIGGKTYSDGYVYLTLKTADGNSYTNKFYIFDELPCKSDGLLGLDFLSNFNSHINLENNTLTLKNGTECVMPIHNTPKMCLDFITFPARSESIHYIKLQGNIITDDCVILGKQLQENLFLGSTIVKPTDNIIPIKVLNTSNETITLPTFQPDLQLLNEYQQCNFSKSESNSERAKQLLPLLKLDHLHTSQRKTIESICTKYSDIFNLPGDKLTTTKLYEHNIYLKPNCSPIYTKPYRLPNSQKPEIDRQIKQMLKDDIIEEAQSEWSSPILLVPKKSDNNDKKWRLVVDYRKLNEVIQDDKFPLPNITEILESLSGAVYFSHLDLSQSYYQVTLNSESRKLTAFTTNTGQYQMKRMPMGLKTSPSSFSRLMTIAMSGLTYEKCFIYLDDLVVFGRNLEIHNKNLINIFDRLRKVNLKLNPNKCNFLKTELLYLGHTVTSEGIMPDKSKIKVIESYPKPANTDDVKRFVAFCNYYRKFIKNFAEIASPLNNLCRKDVPFVWSDNCENAFVYLKNALISPSILQYPDFSEDNEFVLQTDASGIAVGAVLCNKNMRPIAYASRPLNKAEKNYPTIQKELVAIVWGVKYFRPYLFGRTFTIMTDHKPLLYLFGMKDPSSRLLKFRLVLEEYDFKISYVKGKDNVVADALSRIIITSDELKDINEKIVAVMTRAQKKRMEEVMDKSDTGIHNNDTSNRPDQPKVVELLRIPDTGIEMILIEGSKLKQIKNKGDINVESDCLSFSPKKKIIYVNLDFSSQFTRAVFVKKLREFCKNINVDEICIIKNENNALFIKELVEEVKSNNEWTSPRICILRGVKRIDNDEDKNFIINDYHLLPTSGHAGVRRMCNNIKKKYYWPGIEKDVKDFVRKCEKCQICKQSRITKEPMVITTTASYAFEKIFLDLVGPLDKDIDGNNYILTLQCELSKFVEAYPLKNKETVTVARTLVNNFILRFGIPKTIATDRGSEFMSSTFTEICKLLEIEKLCSTAYHHESIGSLENAHKHLGSYLRTQCNTFPDTWSHWLPFWSFSYNNTIHSVTKYAPYELVFGRPCNIPCRISNNVEPLYNPENYSLELRYRLQVAQNDARNKLLKSKEIRKVNYDKNVKPVLYKKDDLILLKNETASKLENLFKGPYTVIEDNEPNVKILKDNKIEIVHKNRTKLYRTV